jgi:hypothetical protein
MKTLTKIFIIILLLISVSKAQILPLPPTLLSPVTGATNVSSTPNLQWNLSLILGFLSSYRLQVANDPGFNSIVLDAPGLTTNNYTIASGVLTPGVKYYWRVNASILINLTLLTTQFSLASNFTTGNLTGITQINSNIPDGYKLYTNYPNPFNPSTRIRFDLRSGSDVNLVVYDILGKVVNEVLNQNLSPGSYEVEWSAENLTSGVYLYRLTTKEFTDTKKMILSK